MRNQFIIATSHLLSQKDTVFFAAMNLGILRVRSFLTRTFAHNRNLNWRNQQAPGRAPLTRSYLFHLTRLTHLIFPLALLLAARALAQEFQFQSTGVRMGFPAENTSNNFLQSEAFLNYNLWRWDVSSNWRLQSRIDLS